MNGHGVNDSVNGGVKDGVNDGVNDRVNADLEVREQLGRVRRRVLMQHLAGRPAQSQISACGVQRRDRAEIAPRYREIRGVRDEFAHVRRRRASLWHIDLENLLDYFIL